jgi:hypothetical protein
MCTWMHSKQGEGHKPSYVFADAQQAGRGTQTQPCVRGCTGSRERHTSQAMCTWMHIKEGEAHKPSHVYVDAHQGGRVDAQQAGRGTHGQQCASRERDAVTCCLHLVCIRPTQVCAVPLLPIGHSVLWSQTQHVLGQGGGVGGGARE